MHCLTVKLPPLVQIMDCRLVGTKPLSEPVLVIQTLGTNFTDILSKIHALSFKKMHLEMLSAKWQQFCLSLNVLTFDIAVLYPMCSIGPCYSEILFFEIINFILCWILHGQLIKDGLYPLDHWSYGIDFMSQGNPYFYGFMLFSHSQIIEPIKK